MGSGLFLYHKFKPGSGYVSWKLSTAKPVQEFWDGMSGVTFLSRLQYWYGTFRSVKFILTQEVYYPAFLCLKPAHISKNKLRLKHTLIVEATDPQALEGVNFIRKFRFSASNDLFIRDTEEVATLNGTIRVTSSFQPL